MSIKERIEQDVKSALLARDAETVSALRNMKTAIQYAEVDKGIRDKGLSDPEAVEILQKEAKKRQESADLYEQGNNHDRATKELFEKQLIEKYLPKQLSEAEISQLIEEAMGHVEQTDMSAMGKVIAMVKQKSQGAANGATIARLTKERLAGK
jgi:uncharacterized protein YqeY